MFCRWVSVAQVPRTVQVYAFRTCFGIIGIGRSNLFRRFSITARKWQGGRQSASRLPTECPWRSSSAPPSSVTFDPPHHQGCGLRRLCEGPDW